MQRQQSGKYASGMTSNRACVAFLMAIALLIAACAKTPPPEATAAAEQFIRAYFVEDNMAGAAKLASGAAKARLDGLLQQIEAAGVKEPPKEKPQRQDDGGRTAIHVWRFDRICLSHRFRDSRHSADHRETSPHEGGWCLGSQRILADTVVLSERERKACGPE